MGLYPAWAADVKVVRNFCKHFKIPVKNARVTVLIRDLGEVIGVAHLRALRLKCEQQVVTGSAMLNPTRVKLLKHAPIYATMLYHPRAKAFVCEVDAAYLPLILDNPDIQYVCGEERETWQELLK